MIYKQVIYATVVTFLILNLAGILTSFLPIGINTVTRVETESHEMDKAVGMNLILTDNTMTFSSTRPKNYYSLGKFYQINAINNLVLAFLLTGFILLISNQSRNRKVLFLILIGVFSTISTHIPYWNWWGFSTIYTIGVALSNLVSIVGAGLLISYLFFNKVKAV